MRRDKKEHPIRKEATQPSKLKRFFSSLCPCSYTDNNDKEHTHHSLTTNDRTDQTMFTVHYYDVPVEASRAMYISRGDSQKPTYNLNQSSHGDSSSSYDCSEFLHNSLLVEETELFPVEELAESEMLLIGKENKRVLARVSSVNLLPSREALRKTKQSNRTKQGQNFTMFKYSGMEEFWKNRYLNFQKFDRGVKIDESSTFSLVPEAVAQHIASRAKCGTILDAMCGVGCLSLKFANICHTVIANDPNQFKIKCMSHNLSLLNQENIVCHNQSFLSMSDIHPEIVCLQLPPVTQEDSQQRVIDPLTYFQEPSLSQLVSKALSFTDNVIFLLPCNIDVDVVGSILYDVLMESRPFSSVSCSVEVEKVFFNKQLRYVAIYYGPLVNRQVKTKDELDFIYRVLSDQKHSLFKHKDFIKHIRSRHGMIKLLSFLLKSLEQHQPKKGKTLYNFCSYIKEHRILPDKYIQQLDPPMNGLNRLNTLQEEYIDSPDEGSQEDREEESQESEKTRSFDSWINKESQISFKHKECKRETIVVLGKERYCFALQRSSYMEKTALGKSTFF